MAKIIREEIIISKIEKGLDKCGLVLIEGNNRADWRDVVKPLIDYLEKSDVKIKKIK